MGLPCFLMCEMVGPELLHLASSSAFPVLVLLRAPWSAVNHYDVRTRTEDFNIGSISMIDKVGESRLQPAIESKPPRGLLGLLQRFGEACQCEGREHDDHTRRTMMDVDSRLRQRPCQRHEKHPERCTLERIVAQHIDDWMSLPRPGPKWWPCS